MPDLDSSADPRASYYPGSKRLRRAVAGPQPVEKTDLGWDAKPVIKTIRGKEIELFHVGHLGAAVGRASVTMRLWERNGFIPTARMRLSPKNGKGGRRYYTRPQVEAVIAAAEKYGLMDRGAALNPGFTRDVLAAWTALEKN